jgi:hypothetical protein
MGSRCFLAVAVLLAVAGCGVGPEGLDGSGDLASVEQAAKPANPCATVLCPAGTVCKKQGNHAVCVPPGNGNPCNTDADCRLFADYCTGCDCRALRQNAPNPTCSGPGVRCFADPCMNKAAVCRGGSCVVADAPAGEACGPTTCAAGQVCCNASCGICTDPGMFCTQQACL